VGLVALLILIVLFPNQIFNSTFEEHYEEIKGWFRLPRVLSPLGRAWRAVHRRTLGLVVFAVIGAFLLALLEPDFGLNRGWISTLVGLGVGLAVVTLAFDLPQLLYVRARSGQRGWLQVLPASLVVAVAGVALSRAVGFYPGYLYGLIAAYKWQEKLEEREEARAIAISAGWVLGVSLAAWFAWIPIGHMAEKAHPGLAVTVADAVLATVFIMGIEGLAIGFLPMRFLDGGKVYRWSRPVWGAIYGASALVFVLVLLNPQIGYLHHGSVPTGGGPPASPPPFWGSLAEFV